MTQTIQSTIDQLKEQAAKMGAVLDLEEDTTAKINAVWPYVYHLLYRVTVQGKTMRVSFGILPDGKWKRVVL